MKNLYFLESIPIGWTFVLTMAIILVSILIGFVIARRMNKGEPLGDDSASQTIVGSTLGLLAFMLAFTFGMSATRFNERKHLFIEEVNAIETTSLRCSLIPEPHRGEVRRLLVEYLKARVDMVTGAKDPWRAVEDAGLIQDSIWKNVETVSDREGPRDPLTALFVDAVNNMFDLQTLRVNYAMIDRIPAMLWYGLFALIIISMFKVGYIFGKKDKANWFVILSFSFAFALVILIIVDLESGNRGSIQVNQKP
jgi:CDP-diglyceride synthetase